MEDLTGKKFGRLTVEVFAGRSRKGGHFIWKCICDCGKSKIVLGQSLRDGNTKSCGCLKRENPIKAMTAAKMKHGHTIGKKNSRDYQGWLAMRRRCYSPQHRAYPWYGGRGIKVCDRWKDDFSAFLADMGPRPPKMEIDRINTENDYSPENCRWVTRLEQMRNRRNTVQVTINDVTRPLKEWAEISGLSYKLLHARYKKKHWNIERLLDPKDFTTRFPQNQYRVHRS